MIGRLFGKSAEPLETLSEASPIDKQVLGVFGSLPQGTGKKIKSVGDAVGHLREACDNGEFNIHRDGFEIARSSKDLHGRQMKQLSLIMSQSLDEEMKTRFLGEAAQTGATGILSEMIAQKDPVACAPETMTLMAGRASRGGQLETFSALREMGAEHENSLLYVAIEAGDYSAARALIAEGVDPSQRNENGNTVLHAAGRGQLGSLAEEIVAAAGPDIIHARNDEGRSFLSEAFDPLVGNELNSWLEPRARDHDLEKMIDLAATNGFDFGQVDNDGNTLMHGFAACKRNFKLSEDVGGSRYKIEKKLSALGVDKMAMNNDGRTAGDIALADNTMEASVMLTGGGYLPSTQEGLAKAIEGSIKTGHGRALSELSKGGADWVESLGGAEAAPFQVVLKAAEEKSPKPVEAARAAGLSFDVRNEKDETPFSVAREMCDEETLGALREIKMDIVAADLQSKARGKAAERAEKTARRKSQEHVR